MAHRVHRDQVRAFLAGIVTLAALGVVAMVGIRANSGGEIPTQGYTYVRAAFADVGMLEPSKQDVRFNSVPIGQVTGTEYVDGRAIVTLRLDGDFPVYADATAQVLSESALGRKFVELDPGSSAAGPLGDRVIPESRTTDSIALDDLLNVFDDPTRAALRSSMVQLGGGAAGHGQDLHDALQAGGPALEDLGTVSRAVTSEDADLPGLLHAADRLAGRLTDRQAQITALLREADTTLRAVSVDDAAPLAATLQGLPPTLRAARQALDAVDGPLADVGSTVTTIRPGAEALGRSAGDLRGVLREAVTPLEKVPGVADEAGPAVGDLTDTLADARPLVGPLGRTLDAADTAVAGLAPYAQDIGRFFAQLADPDGLLSGSFAPGQHYFQIILATPPGPGLVSAPDPTMRTDPYPTPGGGAFENPEDTEAEGSSR